MTPDHIKTLWWWELLFLEFGTKAGEGANVDSVSGTKDSIGGLVGGKIGNGGSTGGIEGAAIGVGGNDIDETGKPDGEGDGDGEGNGDGDDDDDENCNNFLSLASPVWITFLKE